MSQTIYPFILPGDLLEDPVSPGNKLCPRCSKGGNVCCAVEPAITIIRGKIVPVLGEPFSNFTQGEREAKHLYVCRGRCDQKGNHHD